jgi:sulfotransferase famil protein
MAKSILNQTDFNRLFSRMPELLTHVNFLEVGRSINISTKYKYVFLDVPKNASSYIKLALHRMEFGNLAFEHGTSDDLHDRTYSPLLSPFQVADFPALLEDPAYLKFSVIRNPADRIKSAYIEKVKTRSVDLTDIHAKLGKPLSDAIALDEFVYAVGTQMVHEMDPHWRIQLFQSFRDCIDGVKVYRLDQLDRLFGDLSSHVGFDVGPYVPSEPMNVVGSNVPDEGFFTEGLISVLRAKFKADFDLFESLAKPEGLT